ncbi:thioesterase II family protein [Burkholderia sp. Ac-20379]|uniref:thioesterase II family protein n=1 Tax=Burkholderia sp. Ac-20379 TaxID=2703900 RepID=UPI00197DF4E7|nr:alpha/beta fold hydrolase [Burkholderia sp. Ac-20379]MBN3725304.1 thioesterase [Burkholderia sp. Ac-20379]
MFSPRPLRSAWFRKDAPRPLARARLICLPHAGGTAGFFREWAALLPDAVELLAVQYPGREERIDDAMIDAMPDLVARLADAMTEVADLPYVLFGHSMGAAIAYELCVELLRRGTRLPRRLAVSAREAPHRHRPGHWHAAGDAELCEELLRLGGTASALRESDDLRALVLPIVRNDYRLIETYRPAPDTVRLPLPIDVFVGRDDPEVTREEAEDWHYQSSRDCCLREFDGGHFYLQRNARALIGQLLAALPVAHDGVRHGQGGGAVLGVLPLP